MFEQLWKTVQTGGKVALGEEVGTRPVAKVGLGAPAGSVGSDMPGIAKAAKATEQVRGLAMDKAVGSWAKLNEEFRVQKLVWESLALTQKEKKADIAAAEAKVRTVLSTQQGGNAVSAITLLQELVQTATQGDVLSISMLQSAKDVIKQDGLVSKRNRLADRLARAGSPEAAVWSDREKKDLEDLVTECALEDKRLERRVRQVLLLPVPDELGDPVAAKPSGSFAPVAMTGSRTLSQLVGGVPLWEPVSVTGSRMSTSGKGDVVSGKKSLSSRGQSLGAIATATESMRSSASVKPGTAAARVRKMAADCPGAAWAKLEEEFEVQKMVWQSVALTKIKPSDKTAFQAESDTIVAKVGEMLALRRSSPEQALAACERLVASPPKDREGKDALNPATRCAAQDVLNQHEIAPLRLQLAERLDVANVPATLPRGAAQKKEVEDLVKKCDLGDPSLQLIVRQMLLLPIPAELSAFVVPAMGVKKTQSKMSAVSGRRSNSSSAVGSKASRKDSLPVGVRAAAQPRPDAPKAAESQGLKFQPSARLMESI